MAGTKPSLFLAIAIVSGMCASVSGQTDRNAPSSNVRELPAPGLLPGKSPFAIDPSAVSAAQSVRVLSENEMPREDHDLVADAESSIREKAGFENMEFEGAGWTYHELVCAALPNHMFLRFTRDDGTRQMSMFSAAIPRNGNGSVHIIPIVRKGYSLFSPAPIGALTIAAFTGLCYAALAGANPVIPGPEAGDLANLPLVIPPTLRITTQGSAIIHFADVSTASRPVEWILNFDSRGKLVKASHTAASVAHVRGPIPGPVSF
jgi:hypothetical protein